MQEPTPFANRPRQIDRVSAKLVRGDERKCTWIPFPNGKAYMLPVVARHQKLVPVFDEEGGVSVKVIPHDEKLSGLVDQFLLHVASSTGNQFEATPNIYGAFCRLVKALLEANYDFSTEEISEILTFSGAELSRLWSAILVHITSN